MFCNLFELLSEIKCATALLPDAFDCPGSGEILENRLSQFIIQSQPKSLFRRRYSMSSPFPTRLHSPDRPVIVSTGQWEPPPDAKPPQKTLVGRSTKLL